MRPLALLVALEAVLLFLGAIFFLLQLLSQQAASIAGTIVIVLIALILCVGLCVSAWQIQARKYWPRGGILAWQVIQVTVSWSLILGEIEWRITGFLLLLLSLSTGVSAVLTRSR